jgi:hypothetical protein
MIRLKFALWGAFLLTQAASAEQTYQLGELATASISGFVKEELHVGSNQSKGLVDCNFTDDPRGVFGQHCQPGPANTASHEPFNLSALTGDLSHEFDSAWKIAGRLTFRLRNNNADIVGQDKVEENLAVNHPRYGELRAGSMLTRSWSRSDSFSYPIGLSSAWSETGAGYGVVRKALRYTGPMMELEGGKKLLIEGTYATENPNYSHHYLSTPTYNEATPTPKQWEIFAQYADTSNLVEYIYQQTKGGKQSSFGKGLLVGDVGNADGLGIGKPGDYTSPAESVHILQGNHYFNTNWFTTFGIKRNYWSGVAFQCDFAPLPDGTSGCYFPSGFSNTLSATNPSLNTGHSTWSIDIMGGISRMDGLWTYSAGFVRLNKAFSQTPTEYGQSNTATFLNLGVYRRMPELYKNLQVYAGLGQVRFGRYGPAPTSMPGELAISGVDPRSNRFGNSVTIGAGLTF